MLLCLKYLGSTSLANWPWSNTWKLFPLCWETCRRVTREARSRQLGRLSAGRAWSLCPARPGRDPVASHHKPRPGPPEGPRTPRLAQQSLGSGFPLSSANFTLSSSDPRARRPREGEARVPREGNPELCSEAQVRSSAGVRDPSRVAALHALQPLSDLTQGLPGGSGPRSSDRVMRGARPGRAVSPRDLSTASLAERVPEAARVETPGCPTGAGGRPVHARARQAAPM